MHDPASDHSLTWIRRIHHIPALATDKLSYWKDIREQWIVSFDLPPSDAMLLGSSQEVQSKHHTLTMFYDELTVASAGYIEEQLERKGYGKPPAPYAFIQLGSGGRKEMTPWSDQDHGLIWADVDAEERERVEHYFAQWSQQYAEATRYIGFPPCTGNVSASNPEWRGSLSMWLDRTKQWMSNPNWEHMRTFTMALDMRTIYGEQRLEQQWRMKLKFLQADRQLLLSQAIIGNLLHRKRALNSFGQWIRERYGDHAGLFDVKYRIYVPIAQMTRATAWIYGIYDQNYSTGEKLKGLLKTPIPNDLKLILTDVDKFWYIVLALRLTANGKMEQDGWQSSGMVNLDELPVVTKQALKRVSHASIKWMRWLERRGGHER